MKNTFNWTLLLLITISCASQAEEDSRKSTEMHRPQYHFTPPSQWMNDPNGMFFYEGEYHLFYQYYPDSNVWGPMHWGHAVSSDMLRWEHLPIALYPDSIGYIFSGSAVVDWNNTSGFGTMENPPIIAIYTYHNMEGEQSGRTDYQSQGIAFSLDNGRNWKKYEGNPVLPNQGVKDFRDPKVSWFEADQKWVMTLAEWDHVSFYSSKDLKSWKKESDFGLKFGSHAGVWECPDLFELKVNGSDESQWVLLVSINPGGPQGGSATQYFVGEFDGNEFQLSDAFAPEVTKNEEGEQAIWLDYGADNYAGVTWSDIPANDGRRLFMGWMSNWQYAQIVPTTTWRSAMTLPRELILNQAESKYRIQSKTVKEIETMLGPSESVDQLATETYLVELEVNGDFELVLSNSRNEKVTISGANNQLIFDRSNSGIVDFHKAFPASHAVETGELEIENIKVFVDLSSIEVFINDGELVLTELVFPNEPYIYLMTEGSVLSSTVRAVLPVLK